MIVPYAAHAPDAVVKSFQDYIREGGLVLTVGNCFTHDEYGRIRKQGLKQCGEGQLRVYPDPLSPYAYRDILDRLLDATGVVRPVRVKGKHGEALWGVNLRSVESGSRRLVSLINLSRDRKTVCLSTQASGKSAFDLVSNMDMDKNVVLNPLEFVLLRFDMGTE